MVTYTHNPLDLTPEMTANDAPSPNVVSASSELWSAFGAFAHTVVSADGQVWVSSTNNTTGWLKFDFGNGNAKTVVKYILSFYDGATSGRAPKTWTLQGSNNDTDWTTLDTQTNVAGWSSSEMRTYEFINSITYRYYKLDVTANQGDATYLIIGELEFIGTSQIFTFDNPIPSHLSTTISGEEESYTYNAAFYDGFGSQIGTTVLGINSGSSATSNAYLSTPSGIDYNWYVVATSSGSDDTSSTYTFSNRFLYEGYVTENGDPISRVVRLYYRNTGELIDSTTSSGGGGYYSLDATVNDEHFIVAFDDVAGEDYNSLILDRLLPNGE